MKTETLNSNINILKKSITEYFLKPTLEKQKSAYDYFTSLIFLITITSILFLGARYLTNSDIQIHMFFKCLVGLLFIFSVFLTILYLISFIWWFSNMNNLKTILKDPENNVVFYFKKSNKEEVFSFEEILQSQSIDEVDTISVKNISFLMNEISDLPLEKKNFDAILSEIIELNGDRDLVVNIFADIMKNYQDIPDLNFLIIFKIIAEIENENLKKIDYLKISEKIIPTD